MNSFISFTVYSVFTRITSSSTKNQSLDTATNVEEAKKKSQKQASTVHMDRDQKHTSNLVARRSPRTQTSPQRLTPAMESVITTNPEGALRPPSPGENNDEEIREIFALNALFPDDTNIDPDLTLCAMKATSDPDTLYFHEAIRTPDRAKFIKAMEKEISDNNNNYNFQLIHRRKIPTGCTVLPSVWKLRRK